MTQTQYAAPAPPDQAYGAPPRSDLDMSLFLQRWLRVWIALITVILLVVIVYLFFITGSLSSIDENLEPTERRVAGAGSDVDRLPDQVQSINRSLESIDPSLKPISGQLDEIINALNPIDSRLKTTAGSLVNTAGMLQGVSGNAADIRNVVASAQSPGSLGTELIWKQVGVANSALLAVDSDARNILAGLRGTNKHLDQIP